VQKDISTKSRIIESGFVSDMSKCRQTVAALAKQVQVVIYFRAGNAQSPALH
jgi:hypothetical protein